MTDHKKETLSYEDAVKIYAESGTTGFKIQGRDGWMHWIEDGEGLTGYWPFDKGNKAGFPGAECGPFTLIPPRHRQPTLEECLRANAVKFTPPEGITFHSNVVRKGEAGWFQSEFNTISNALTNNWPVEIVET